MELSPSGTKPMQLSPPRDNSQKRRRVTFAQPIEGFCTLAMLKYNFARRSLVGQNESGLYDVGFLGQPKTGLSRCRSGKRNALRRQQRTESQYISVQTNELGSAAQAGGSFGPPMSSSLAADRGAAGSLSDPDSEPPDAQIAIWPVARGYCSCPPATSG
ncbi:hypothetical protein T09_15651 [Trichinella sp. T9]|nr:hypothetical protein T09_15651 [Trichinella sp. T9]